MVAEACRRKGAGSEGPSQAQQSSLPGYRNERLKPGANRGYISPTLWRPYQCGCKTPQRCPHHALLRHANTPTRQHAVTPLRRHVNKSLIDIRLFPVLGDVEAGSLNFGIGS
jgi:hypothetical protein